MKPCYADLYSQKDPYADEFNRCPVVHCTADSVLGYKYFDFTKTHGKKDLKLELNLVPQGVDAKVEVWAARPCAEEGGVKVGEFAISKSWPDTMRKVTADVAPLAGRNAREALYFVFKADMKEQSICEIEDFRLTTWKRQARNDAGERGVKAWQRMLATRADDQTKGVK